MKTVFITISRGSLIRNFFHTGIIGGLLQKNCRVVVLTPNHDDQSLFDEFQHPNLFFEPLYISKIKFEHVLTELFKGAVFNKTVHFLWRHRLAGASPRMSLYVPRMLFLAPLRFVPGFKRFIQWIDAKLNPQQEHDYLFEKYAPDLAFITASNSYSDSGVTKSAQRFGVPTVGMPKSWDNLSKILNPATTDYVLVWSEFMKQQAIRHQGYREHQITVTGVPQFDIYAHPEHLVSREEFCKKFNFDPNKKIVLYGSVGGGNRIGMEADYPEMIQEWIDSGELSGVQVLVRPHIGYPNDPEKFQRLAQCSNIAIDRTDTRDARMPDHWDPSFNHLAHLYNSLHHADACVTIGSTLTLDAIACGTPVVNIKFDKDPGTLSVDSVRRLHGTDYVAALTSMGATWVAESKESFLQALKAILERGEQKDTQEMINEFMYRNDGKSAERIVDTIVEKIESEKSSLE